MGESKVKFKVKSSSNVHSCSLSLFKLLSGGNDVEMLAIGASAVNQAVKIIVKTRASIAQAGKDLFVKIGMRNEIINDKDLSITVFNFVVK